MIYIVLQSSSKKVDEVGPAVVLDLVDQIALMDSVPSLGGGVNYSAIKRV